MMLDGTDHEQAVLEQAHANKSIRNMRIPVDFEAKPKELTGRSRSQLGLN